MNDDTLSLGSCCNSEFSNDSAYLFQYWFYSTLEMGKPAILEGTMTSFSESLAREIIVRSLSEDLYERYVGGELKMTIIALDSW